MSLTRRGFAQTLGVSAAGSLLAPLVTARGLEALVVGPRTLLGKSDAIRLNANENPDGPGQAALDGIVRALSESNRYPMQITDTLRSSIAQYLGVFPENVIVSCGSTDILRSAVYAFTSPAKALVVASPTFESPGQDAARIGSPVREIPVTADLHLDLPAMLDASHGAGLVYLCNPNNPTATVHGADKVKQFIAGTDATVLVDEAYHEYVDEPTYATMVPVALENPRVVVTRTFSKVFGLAGLRIGYAVGQPATLKAIAYHTLRTSVNQLGAAAAIASIAARDHIEKERVRNRETRQWTREALTTAGYPSGQSDANFMMVNVRRDTKQFADACRSRGILVGRPFPPLMNYARISIGTSDEMHQALDVFRRVLATA